MARWWSGWGWWRIASQSFALQSTYTTVIASPADSTTYYFGQTARIATPTLIDSYRIYIPKACVLRKCFVTSRLSTLGTSETSTLSIVVNGATEYTVSSVFTNDATNSAVSDTALNIPLNAWDYICMKWVTPARVTNPTGVWISAVYWFDWLPSTSVGDYVLWWWTSWTNPLDSTTYYMSDSESTTSSSQGRIYIPATWTITAAYIFNRVATVLWSWETFTISIRKNNTTDYDISTAVVLSATSSVVSNASMSVPVTAGDYIQIKIAAPARVTNPTGISSKFTFLITRS